MNRRCAAAVLLMSISIVAAGCAPSDDGQEPDDAPPASASPTVDEDRNPDDGY